MQRVETPGFITCDQAACLQGRRVMVEADRGGGKTEAAVRRVAHLVGEGASPDSILVVTATDEAAAAFARRAVEADPACKDVLVRSSFSLAAAMVCDASDSVSAVATAPQRNFLVIDALTALRDEAGGQADIPGSLVQQAASEAARRIGLVFADEVYGHALAMACEGRIPAWLRSVGYVVADDWDVLGDGARQLCEALGVVQCFAAGAIGSPFMSDGACEQVRLCSRQDGSLRIRTFAGCVEASDSRAHDDALRCGLIAPDDGSVQIVKWRTAQAELDGMASLVKGVLSRHARYTPSDVCVVVPNSAWAKVIRKCLYDHMLDSTESLAIDPLAADPRRAAASGALASYIRLNLLAHPHEELSWRMWAGFGRRDLAAHAWLAFTRWRTVQGLDFETARKALCAESAPLFQGADALCSSFAEAEAFLGRSRGLRGLSLLSCVCPDEDPAFLRLAEGVQERDDALSLCLRVAANARFQRFDGTSGSVRICSASHMAGLDFGTVIIAGAVDGFLPHSGSRAGSAQSRDFDTDAQRALFCSAAAKARDELIISLFQKAPENVAADFGMRVMRKKTENGQSVAMLRPSPFIASAGNAAPGAQSAEQFIAMH